MAAMSDEFPGLEFRKYIVTGSDTSIIKALNDSHKKYLLKYNKFYPISRENPQEFLNLTIFFSQKQNDGSTKVFKKPASMNKTALYLEGFNKEDDDSDVRITRSAGGVIDEHTYGKFGQLKLEPLDFQGDNMVRKVKFSSSGLKPILNGGGKNKRKNKKSKRRTKSNTKRKTRSKRKCMKIRGGGGSKSKHRRKSRKMQRSRSHQCKC